MTAREKRRAALQAAYLQRAETAAPAIATAPAGVLTQAAPAPKRTAGRLSYLLLILPALVLLPNTSYIYSPPGMLDPWVYYGYMRNFIAFKGGLFPGTYYGSRLSWLLPGFAINRIFPPVAANYILHLAVFYTAVFAAYALVKRMMGRRAALLTAILLGFTPAFWAAAGWDYVDGSGIAYCLLAMALTAAAAAHPRNRLLLTAAGAAYACLIYSNIVWLVFSPVFPALYAWQRPFANRRLAAGLASFVLWFAAGWAIVTTVLGAINYFVEGSFWFYAPSVLFSISTMGGPNPWKAKDYSWVRTAYWLALPAIGCTISGIVCARRVFAKTRPPDRATVFFAVNLLYSAGILVLMEARGRPALQLYYYASYLIPGTTLLLGAALFDQFAFFSARWFRVMTGAAIAAGVGIWWFSAFRWGYVAVFKTLVYLFAAGVLTLICGAVWRRHPVAVAAAIFGFGSVCIVTKAMGGSPPGNSTAAAFRRIVAGMEAVERGRRDNPVKFWFSQEDPNSAEFHSINACYLWAFVYMNFQFPYLEPTRTLANGSVIVVPSSRPDILPEAQTAFIPRGQRVRLLEKTRIADRDVAYWIHILEVETDWSRLIPQQISFNGTGEGRLIAAGGTEPVAFPMDKWEVCENSGSWGTERRVPEGILMETAPDRWAWGFIYPAMYSSEGGTYHFLVKYRLLAGDIEFGALKGDKSTWLKQSGGFHKNGEDWVREFSLALHPGETIRLLTSNNQGVNKSSRFVLEGVTAYREKDAAQ
jgi:hypothetical protein